MLKAPKRGRGRPKNALPGPEAWMIEHSAAYNSLRASRAPQSAITTAANVATFELIAHYGWDEPLRRKEPVQVHATSVDIDKVKASALLAENAMKGVAAGIQTLSASSEAKMYDRTVRKVRGEILKVWRINYDKVLGQGKGKGPKPTYDIAALIKAIISKPRQRQAYIVWAQSKQRPELEVAIDQHHSLAIEAAARRGLDPPGRGISWNAVAADYYRRASIEEKEETQKQAEVMHARETAEWEAKFRDTPQSPEEALKFMEQSQDFMRDLMQFFSNRMSAYAFCVFAGPQGATLISEAAPALEDGMPKILYTHANPQSCEQFRSEIAIQARILNETRWGPRSTNSPNIIEVQTRSNALPLFGTTFPQDTPDTTSPAPRNITMPVVGEQSLPAIDHSLGQFARSPSEKAADLPSSNGLTDDHHHEEVASRGLGIELVDDQGSIADDDASTSTSSSGGMEEDFTNMIAEMELHSDLEEEADLMPSGSGNHFEEAGMPVNNTNEHSATSIQPAQDTHVSSLCSSYSEGADTRAQTHVASPQHDSATAMSESPMITSGRGPDGTHRAIDLAISRAADGTGKPPSIFAFDLKSYGDATLHEMSYDAFAREYSAAVAPVLLMKTWFGEIQTEKWLISAPRKLEKKVSIRSMAWVYRIILRYLLFEGSAMRELPLEMRRTMNMTTAQPRYMAEVPQRQAINQTAMRWHTRATIDKPRTASALDADVANTLPRQWALLQPAARLDPEGRIRAAANSSMNWSEVLAPGIDGVRVLVVTVLQWAYNLQEDEEEEWQRLVIDIHHVLQIIQSQQPLREAAVGNGFNDTRKLKRIITKSAKLRDA